jgi:ABC-type multidrug transport system ATPase subunit
VSEIFLKSNDLSLGYSNQIVIKGMNLNLFDEKNYQIIGKNGAGKTTLMNFISSNFDGTNFESKVDRLNISVNQISSTPTLIYDLTLEENLNYFTSDSSISTENKLNVVFKYIPRDYLDEKVKNFSSGMIRRVELSIIEIKNPSVFCIDEPLNFLDSEGVSLLTNLIKNRSSSSKCNILSSQEFVKLDDVDFEVIDLDEN